VFWENKIRKTVILYSTKCKVHMYIVGLYNYTTTTFSVASSRTVMTSYSRICLTITKFHISCAHDLIPWL